MGYGEITIEGILGFIFSPLAFAIGIIPWSEAVAAGSFIGQKLVLNELVVYNAFDEMGNFSVKTNLIVSFSLCGFANLSSMAILLGGFGSLAPNRRPDIARLGFKALIAGALASLLGAAIAGMFL